MKKINLISIQKNTASAKIASELITLFIDEKTSLITVGLIDKDGNSTLTAYFANASILETIKNITLILKESGEGITLRK